METNWDIQEENAIKGSGVNMEGGEGHFHAVSSDIVELVITSGWCGC